MIILGFACARLVVPGDGVTLGQVLGLALRSGPPTQPVELAYATGRKAISMRIVTGPCNHRDVRFLDAAGFTADRPWGALDIAEIDPATVRLHWTNEPYVWHLNDGPEVFVVLDGAGDMHYRDRGAERIEHLVPGRICLADVGDEHVAHPTPEARILVIERKGSI